MMTFQGCSEMLLEYQVFSISSLPILISSLPQSVPLGGIHQTQEISFAKTWNPRENGGM